MTKEICVPAAGESVTEADIVTWYKEDGDYVEMDEALLELETDKASMDLTAEAGGILSIKVEEGTVKVGDVVGTIDDSAAKPAATVAKTDATPVESSAPAAAVKEEKTGAAPHYAASHPSPAAQKALGEKGLSASDVSGTGRDGRITKQDVAGAAPKAAPEKVVKKEEASVAAVATPGERGTRREKLSRLRKTLLTRLVDAQQTTASLTTFNEVDMSAVMNIRKHHKEAFKEKYNVGLGFMSFFTKAVTIALQNWPLINAMIDGDEILFHDYCDIGVAVATPKGLVVPVIKNAENLSFAEIESTIKAYALKGRDGKITLDDMSGGTFTITNGGTFGSMLSTPILNRPQSAILGMHNIVQRPTAVNGQVEIRPIMYLALTYDHRIIDGAEAVQFLVNIKQLLEDPTRLLIGM
ncbi:dihydrolipoyllysine-residue succinyltransferase [Candidatus Marinamargulisbacteria bacterium SCGC AG-343-D04]|nr:dihydrolipoyllysine-residue succinyltransferase [Candidatus Marinamargulisbacteria bacterium SCGC AG-343-D04]